MLFILQQDKFVLLYSKGIYRQAKVYLYNNKYYAKWSGGFIKLNKNSTSLNTVQVLSSNFNIV